MVDILARHKAKLVPLVKKTPSQKRTFEQIVSDAIDVQIRIVDGEEVRGSKGSLKNGVMVYPLIKSWRNQEGLIQIRIGTKKLFENKAIQMPHDEYKQFLWDLKENWEQDPDISAELLKIKAAIEETNAKRSKTRKRS